MIIQVLEEVLFQVQWSTADVLTRSKAHLKCAGCEFISGPRHAVCIYISSIQVSVFIIVLHIFTELSRLNWFIGDIIISSSSNSSIRCIKGIS